MATNPAVSLYEFWSEVARRHSGYRSLSQLTTQMQRYANDMGFTLHEAFAAHYSRPWELAPIDQVLSLAVDGYDENGEPILCLMRRRSAIRIFRLWKDGRFSLINTYYNQSAVRRRTFLATSYVAQKKHLVITDQDEWLHIGRESTRVNYLPYVFVTAGVIYRLVDHEHGWKLEVADDQGHTQAQQNLDYGYEFTERRWKRWHKASLQRTGLTGKSDKVKVEFFLGQVVVQEVEVATEVV